MPYPHQEIESKWIEKWNSGYVNYRAGESAETEKRYILAEFPFPSGSGLHVGHLRSYVALDIMARRARMQGYDVLYPMGWDAFGLPTENYALKHGISPQQATKENIDNFKQQLAPMGLSFDWSREINTTDPDYYKWTQWLFLQFYHQNLAYKEEVPVYWCPNSQITLAAEEVSDGKSIQTGEPVEKMPMKQWMLAITEYADRLLEGLDEVDYLEEIKTQQRNWIGRSEGARIYFSTQDETETIEAFTTRPDTIYGATYMVLAPEHPAVSQLLADSTNPDEVKDYIDNAQRQTDRERQTKTEKTGVQMKDVFLVHPLTQAYLPVFVADYVLMDYGTGAIMAVPAHDERDYEFARRFELSITPVIKPHRGDVPELPYTEYGELIQSGEWTGMSSTEAISSLTTYLEEHNLGKKDINYKMRDWVFSRQRYWGEPIPIVYCEECGEMPVPEDQLPVELPEVDAYEPTETGDSPLANIDWWVNTECPHCGASARRETDTMPNWAGSSWYYLRYIDPHNEERFANYDKLAEWLPVDLYNGGMEHVTLHLLYSRFWHQFLYDLGHVPTREPYQKRVSHGIILAEGGVKMSKSKGNTIDPMEMVEAFGADTFRTYEMFMGPYDEMIAWDMNGIKGVYRFLTKVWHWHKRHTEHYGQEINDPARLTYSVNYLVKKVTEDIDAMKFNTAVSALMEFTNEWQDSQLSTEDFQTFIRLLAPFAPHLTEELWAGTGAESSVHHADWPTYEAEQLQSNVVSYQIHINGKMRGMIEVDAGTSEEDVKEQAKAHENVARHLENQTIQKIIVVPQKVVSIVLE